MGKIDPTMAGTPDPKDTGVVGVPENGNPDETTVFQPVGLVEDTDNADDAVESAKKPRPKWLVPAIAGESLSSSSAPVSADTPTP